VAFDWCRAGKLISGICGRILFHSGTTNTGHFFSSINKNKANENAG
jgi:hypothetical protein